MNDKAMVQWTVRLACVVLAGCGGAQTTATPAAGGGQTAFGSTEKVDGALEGKVYHLAEGTDKLPDFSTLQPQPGSVWATRLDVAPRNFQEGFPGVTQRFEWFALRYAGTWTVPTAGKWGFRLLSDDGSRLLIDGKVVVDNDGVHGPDSQEGSTDLTAGAHSVEVQFFQGPATELALQVFATPPGGQEAIWAVR